MKVKTVLYLIHRWLGICICLPVAMWFATGMVMMYVGFPELSERERYAGLPALDPETILHGPAKLVTTVPDSAPIEHLMLTSSGPRPLYLLKIKGSSLAWPICGYGRTGEEFSSRKRRRHSRAFLPRYASASNEDWRALENTGNGPVDGFQRTRRLSAFASGLDG